MLSIAGGLQRTPQGGKPPVNILLAAPSGFCAGVRRAIQAVEDALIKHGAPVYVRRPIVHNLAVVRTLESKGAIFIEELEQAPQGSVVIFSAHGVAPQVWGEAEGRHLQIYDAVCPLVAKVHREVERHRRNGRKIILIGHEGHPEIEGTLGRISQGSAFVVRSVAEVDALPLVSDVPVAYAVQTTYSVDDARNIIEALRARFSDLAEPPTSDICYATTNRQAAVRTLAQNCDAIIVVGEQFSSNGRRLAEVARDRCARVQLIANASELEWGLVRPGGVIGIAAAASTPESSVREVIDALAERFDLQVETLDAPSETTTFKRVAVG